jgi:Fic family protein
VISIPQRENSERRPFAPGTGLSWTTDKVGELLDHINKNIAQSKGFVENSLLAFDSHFQMVSIHPFADGNGRLSRLLMNYVQHYHDQPMTIVSMDAKQEYFDALEETRNNEDIKVFRNFMFNQSYNYFQKEISNLTKEQKQDNSKGRGLSFMF